MPDPFSFIANVTAVLGVTAQSCQYLMTFFSNILDAPAEIEHYSRWLRALLSTLSELQRLIDDPSIQKQLSFNADFTRCLKDCKDDLQDMESRVLATSHKLKANRVRRNWTKFKYGFMSEHSMAKFSRRLQMYQSTFSIALASNQL
jgi:hypothetical protein